MATCPLSFCAHWRDIELVLLLLIKMATVPAPAAAWIATYLRGLGMGIIEWKEQSLSQTSGLNVLTGA